MKLIDAEKLIEYIKEKECDLCICAEGTYDCVGYPPDRVWAEEEEE